MNEISKLQGRLDMQTKEANGATYDSAKPAPGWTVIDKPGVFLMVPKGLLQVDHSYQRNRLAKQTMIRKMALQWSWTACGTLTVADRGGELYVIDGQGRKMAADRRPDIDELPCMVFETTAAAEEAMGFLAINGDRKAVLAQERFNALVKIGDKHALFVAKLLEDSNRCVGFGPAQDNVRCVGLLLKAASIDHKALEIAWHALVKVCDTDPIIGELVAGAFVLQRTATGGASLNKRPWSDRFVAVGYKKLMQSVFEAKAYHGSRGSSACAAGIAKAMNYGRRRELWHFEMPRNGEEDDVPLRPSLPDVGMIETA